MQFFHNQTLVSTPNRFATMRHNQALSITYLTLANKKVMTPFNLRNAKLLTLYMGWGDISFQIRKKLNPFPVITESTPIFEAKHFWVTSPVFRLLAENNSCLDWHKLHKNWTAQLRARGPPLALNCAQSNYYVFSTSIGARRSLPAFFLTYCRQRFLYFQYEILCFHLWFTSLLATQPKFGTFYLFHSCYQTYIKYQWLSLRSLTISLSLVPTRICAIVIFGLIQWDGCIVLQRLFMIQITWPCIFNLHGHCSLVFWRKVIC